jgi:thioredoxin 1
VSDHIIHVTDDSFDQDVLKSPTPVLVDYWAEWCGPCKMIAPALDQVAQEYAGRLKVAKLNIDENQATPPKFGIRGIPTSCSSRTATSKRPSRRPSKTSSTPSLTATSETDTLDPSWLFLPAAHPIPQHPPQPGESP